MRFFQTVLLLMALVTAAFSQQKEFAKSPEIKRVLNTEISRKVNIQYFLNLPEDYGSGNQKYPLIIYLHGSGERGDDLEILNGNGLTRLLNRENIKLPFIIVSPQCPSDDYWSNYIQLENLNTLLDYIIENYNVDQDRIYLTGLSMGGFGTYALSVMYPERFAAIAPICGGWDPADAAKIKHLPIWVFHGAKDNLVPVKYSEDMVEALKNEGADVKFTIYPDAYHDSWTETYFTPELYEWFLSHSKQPDGTIKSRKPRLLSLETRDALLFQQLNQRLSFTIDTASAGMKSEFTLDIENPLGMPISIEKEWSYKKGSAWQVDEYDDFPATIMPGEAKSFRFIATNSMPDNPFPVPMLKLSLSAGTYKGRSELILPWDVDKYLEQNPTFYKAIYTGYPLTIDGTPDDTGQEKSNGITRFVCNDLALAPVVNTKAVIAYDSTFCYLIVKCFEPYMKSLRYMVKENDGPVWTDDSIELFLDPENKRQNYFHIVVNSQGIIYDAFDGNSAFNTEARIAVKTESDCWSLEMAIPWEKLNVGPPESGHQMGFLIGRNRMEKEADKSDGIGQSLQFPATNGSFHRKEFFGILQF